MQLMRGNLVFQVMCLHGQVCCLMAQGQFSHLESPSAVSGCFTPCLIAETAEKSPQNAVLAVNSAGEQEEKNFLKLRAGFAASEFGALSSMVVGGRKGRKRKGKEIGSYLL